jgi:hypothetical protein
MNRPKGLLIFDFLLVTVFLLCGMPSFADVQTVQDQEPKTQYTTRPSERAFILRSASKDDLVSTMTAGYTQGVDSNPLLDSTHKADSFSQENLDMFFRYPIKKSDLGDLLSRFGFNITNINYYEVTDVNTFDANVIAKLEQEVGKDITISPGYNMEIMWFPHSITGNYVGNEANIIVQQRLLDWMYHKFTYRYIFRGYLESKVMMGNGTYGSDLRQDERNLFEYEFGMYLAGCAKLRFVNQYYMNRSNYQYMDYYDYDSFKSGASLVQFFTKRLYHITGLYYYHREYLSREVSVGNYFQKDNLWITSASLMYDLTKQLSLYFNFSYSQNNTNEPLEQYVDSMYTFGCYYSF